MKRTVFIAFLILSLVAQAQQIAIDSLSSHIDPIGPYRGHLLFDLPIKDSFNSVRIFAAKVADDRILIIPKTSGKNALYICDLHGKISGSISITLPKFRRLDYSARFHSLMILTSDEKSIELTNIHTGLKKVLPYTSPQHWYFAKDSIFEAFIMGFRNNIPTYHFNNKLDYLSRFDYDYKLSLLPNKDIIQFWPYMILYRPAPGYFEDIKRSYSATDLSEPIVLDARDSLIVYTSNCFFINIVSQQVRMEYPMDPNCLLSGFCSRVRYYPFDHGRFMELSFKNPQTISVYLWTYTE